MGEEEIFPHVCVMDNCTNTIQRDNEPWCAEHASYEGPTLRGYSAKRAAEQFAELEKRANVEHRNIFDE